MFLDDIKRYSDNLIKLPRDLRITSEEIRRRAVSLSEYIANSTHRLAAEEIADLLEIDLSCFKAIINKHVAMLKLFYKISPTASPRATALVIDARLRDNPLGYLTLLLGFLRFSGHITDVLNISPKELRNLERDKFVKMCLPQKVRADHKILKHICRGSIDLYPDVLYYLAINYILPESVFSSGKAKLPPITLAILRLEERISGIMAKKEKQRLGAEYEKLIRQASKTVDVHRSENTKGEKQEEA